MISQSVAPSRSDRANSRSGSSQSVTDRLLTAGILAGPIYVVVGVAEAFLRPGFDLLRHELSLDHAKVKAIRPKGERS